MNRTEGEWIIADPPDDHPGYLGGRRTTRELEWSQRYGTEGWRYRWQTADGRMMDFDQVFQVYVNGYVKYFEEHRDEAERLVQNYSYGYDLDPITREQAFDPHALYDKPGVRNQFHNVAFNIAVESVTKRHFQGAEPIQVREGKPGTPDDQQPAGYLWSPGRIQCAPVDRLLIPSVQLTGQQWWRSGSVEDFYQRAKILQVRRNR